MPLAKYGVAIGNLIRFYRDPPDNFGHWYHGHVEVSTPSGMWTSALDVDTPSGLGISYRISKNLPGSALGAVATLPSGFHLLNHDSTSGAVDYLRSPFLQDRLFWFDVKRPIGLPRTPQPIPPALAPGESPRPRPAPTRVGSVYETLLRGLSKFDSLVPAQTNKFRLRPWLTSDGNNALLALEAELIGQRKIYLFGERFSGADQGVHDVHQNQGDPPGSQWWSQNGIWQDGAVAVERPDGTLFVWQVRFNSQKSPTDDQGHPIP